MKFINFAVVKFSVFLVVGILIAHFFPLSTLALPYVVTLFFVVVVLWFLARKQLIQNVYFGIVTYLCFFAIGFVSYQMRLPKFQSNHYSQFVATDDLEIIQLKIIQSLKPDKFNLKYFATVIAIKGELARGKVLLNISKDSFNTSYSADDILMVHSSIVNIPKPLNPHQFDYSDYMKSLEVYGQMRISEKSIINTLEGKPTLYGIAQNLRAQIVQKLQTTKLNTNEHAILQALVLGEKKDIDKSLYEEYAAAGAVHILAVSGLHVGIFYVLLAFFFKPLKRWKYGTYFHAILIVILLWGFALLSGLSPSVARAVTMFSFFAIAKVFNRETNSLNTLFLSFLALLIINPLWVFQVGFQLSYLAVFFIVWLLPIFQKIGYSKYRIVRGIWSIITVSLCAQIGVLPLTLYYFHQFPGFFLITNIVVLPFLTLLMFGGILIVILAVLKSLPEWLAESYNYLIEMLNNFIHWVAVQDEFLFQNIHFSTLKVIGAYLLIIALAMYFKKINYQRLVFSLGAIVVFISIYIYDDFKNSQNQFVIFQKSKQTLLAYKNGKNVVVFKNDSTEKMAEKSPIKPFRTAVNATYYSEEKLPSILKYNDKFILILDSLGIIPKQKNIHTIILTSSPKINLNRLIDSLKPQQIIADGSNYNSYVERWEKTCKTKKLLFSHTSKQGAFLID